MKRFSDENLERTYADKLEEAMLDAGVGPEDLDAEGIVPLSSINSYISGKHLPQLRTAVRIANYLGKSMDFFCGEDEDTNWGFSDVPEAPWRK